MGPLRVFQNEYCEPARASFDLAQRGALRLNLYVETFSSGRFPHFRERSREDSYTIRVPLALILRIAEWVQTSEHRVRYQKDRHRWKERFIDLTAEPPRRSIEAKNLLQRIKRAGSELKSGSRKEAIASYRAIREQWIKDQITLSPGEQQEVLTKLQRLYERLKKSSATAKKAAPAARQQGDAS